MKMLVFVLAVSLNLSSFAAVDYTCSTVSKTYESIIAPELNAPRGISGNCEKGDGRLAMALYTLYHVAPSFYKYVKANVSQIKIFTQQSGLGFNAGEASFNDRVVKINTLHLIGDFEQIIATIIHEAAHLCLQQTHVKCTGEIDRGALACDSDFTAAYSGGAINVELVALRYIRNKGNLPSHISNYFLEWRMNSSRTKINNVDAIAWERFMRDKNTADEPPTDRCKGSGSVQRSSAQAAPRPSPVYTPPPPVSSGRERTGAELREYIKTPEGKEKMDRLQRAVDKAEAILKRYGK